MKIIGSKRININIPNVSQQEHWSCGAAALLSILLYFGKGPLNEELVADQLGMDKSGTDPYQIKNVLDKYKLRHKEYRGMTIEQLIFHVKRREPVFIMLQAWGNKENYRKCKKGCKDGHWLIAIGYDKDNIYFEDPALTISRGYIPINELDNRWHDYEYLNENDAKRKSKVNSDHYGLVVFGKKTSKHIIQAEYVE